MSQHAFVPSTPAPSALGIRRFVPIFIVALLIIGLLVWKPPFVVRPLSNPNANSPGGSGTPVLNAAQAYVNPIWDSKIIPAFINKAIDAQILFPAIKENPDQAGEKYGRREATNPYNYMVKGSGQVTAVNTESRAGTLSVALAGAASDQHVMIQIGPVVLGTAIRDATGIVSFNEFTNQIDFAGVSKEMNARAVHDALAGADPASFNGKQIQFVGGFTYDPHSPGVIRIVPVRLEVKK